MFASRASRQQGFRGILYQCLAFVVAATMACTAVGSIRVESSDPEPGGGKSECQKFDS
jgi:hypothetical protein